MLLFLGGILRSLLQKQRDRIQESWRLARDHFLNNAIALKTRWGLQVTGFEIRDRKAEIKLEKTIRLEKINVTQ